MIRTTFICRRFRIIAALSVGLFLTVASRLPGSFTRPPRAANGDRGGPARRDINC